MRKRVIIGLLVVTVIGVGAFFVSQPKKGSVEWHKREYLAAWNRRAENTWCDRLKRAYYKATKTTPQISTYEFHNSLRSAQRDLEKMRGHQKALIELGYLVKRQFLLTNRWAEFVKYGVDDKIAGDSQLIYGRCWVLKETNIIVVLAPLEGMPKYERLIYSLDVAPEGK